MKIISKLSQLYQIERTKFKMKIEKESQIEEENWKTKSNKKMKIRLQSKLN